MKRSGFCMGLAIILALGLLAAPADAGRDHRHKSRPVWYLSLGTSLAAGVQADPETGENVVTEVSYPGLLAEILRQDVPQLQHVNLGCPGENSETFIHGGICEYRENSQLDAAVAFLRRHRKSTGLITIDLGANDILGCVNDGVIDPECFEETVVQLSTNLGFALEPLRDAAGPNIPIVGMNYYNPLLVFWFEDPDLAVTTAILQAEINGALEGVYAVFGAPVADVSDAFVSGDFFSDANNNTVPDNVDLVCAWTWMCAFQNIHPNVAGYEVIASAFVDVLPGIRIPERPRHRHRKDD